MSADRSRWVSLALMLASIGLSSGSVLADAVDEKARAMSVEQLKHNYLVCSQRALCGEVSQGEIAICSIIYEELKLRAFGGDFDKLLAWSRSSGDVKLSRGERGDSCASDQPAVRVQRRT